MTTGDETGGQAATHEAIDEAARPVAPTLGAQFNTLRLPLVPVACWRMDDVRFDFDSSFIRPEAAREFRELVALLQSHEGCPASIFAHADPTGDDGYNKKLSGRRADAVYGLLVRDTALWERLYSNPHGGDKWGLRATQLALETLRPPGGEAPYYQGALSAALDRATIEAVKRFQRDNGLADDGDPGPLTRAKLFELYMDALCADAGGAPFKLGPGAFLGAGADGEGKAARQACSEFNPVLVFSKADEQRFAKASDKTERDAKNSPNRRVLVFLFRKGTRVASSAWPCPRTGEGTDGCRAQFWPDGDARRAARGEERQYAAARDTMACRFYDTFARRSPCEGVVSQFTTVQMKLFDGARKVMAGAPYQLRIGAAVRRGVSNSEGMVVARAVEIPNKVVLEWGIDREASGAGGAVFRFSKALFLTVDEADEAVMRRLHNLGYPSDRSQAENVASFQRHAGLAVTGELDATTEAEIRRAHDELDPKVAPAPPPPPPSAEPPHDQQPPNDPNAF